MARTGSVVSALSIGPDFTRLWFARTISAFGDAVRNITLVWLVKELTGSAVAMGTVMACSALPYLIFGLVAGAVVDRGDRRRLLIACDLASAVVVLTLPALLALGVLRLTHLCLLAFGLSSVAAFWGPAFMAAVPSVVPATRLVQANSLMSVSGQLVGIIAPAAAGFLVVTLGAGAALLVDGLSFLVAAAAISLTSFSGGVNNAAPAGRSGSKAAHVPLLLEVGEGLNHVRRSRPLLVVVVTALALNIVVAPRMVLMAFHVEQVWRAGPEIYGLLASAFSAGTMLGAVTAALWGRRFARGGLVQAALLVNGLAGLGLAVTSQATAGAVTLAVIGLTMVTANIAITSWLQETVPAGMRGRVFATVNVGATATVPAAQAVAGYATAAWGTPAFFLVTAVVTALGGMVLRPVLGPELGGAAASARTG